MKRPRYAIARVEGEDIRVLLLGLTEKMARTIVGRMNRQAQPGVRYVTDPPLEVQDEEIETNAADSPQSVEAAVI